MSVCPATYLLILDCGVLGPSLDLESQRQLFCSLSSFYINHHPTTNKQIRDLGPRRSVPPTIELEEA